MVVSKSTAKLVISLCGHGCECSVDVSDQVLMVNIVVKIAGTPV